MNNRANSNKRSLIYRLVGSFLALVIMICGLPVMSVRAAALDYSPNYVTKITITTLTDADGWNGATATLYCRSRNGRGEEEKIAEWGIKSSIDDEGEVCDLVFSSPDHFPTKVVIWTDFGGGITWRSWEGAVKVYVNGINIKAVRSAEQATNSRAGIPNQTAAERFLPMCRSSAGFRKKTARP